MSAHVPHTSPEASFSPHRREGRVKRGLLHGVGACLLTLGLLVAFAFGTATFAFSSAAPLNPTVTLLAPAVGDAWAGGTQRIIRWDASDASGLITNPITLTVSYNDGADWSLLATALTNSGMYTWSVPLSNTAQVQVQVDAVNTSGEVGSDANETGFTIDSQPPTSPLSMTAQPITWSKGSFTITWNVPDDLSGIGAAYYRFDAPPTSPTDGVHVTTTNILTGLNPAGDGSHLTYVWLVDRAGNVDHTQKANVSLLVDRTPPSPPFNMQGQPAGWSKTNAFTETWSVTPDLSGIAGAYFKLGEEPTSPTDGSFVTATTAISNISVPVEGKHTIFIWLKDGAGNVDQVNRNVDLDAFWYDATPPTTSRQTDRPSGPSGWFSTTVTITLVATDSLSNVSDTSYQLDGGGWFSGSLIPISGEGNHTLDYFSVDVAGNQETIHNSTVSIDSQPPVTSLQIEGTTGPDDWYTESVTLTFSVVDEGAGYFATSFRINEGQWLTGTQHVLSQEGEYTLDYYSMDGAGNTEAIKTTQLRLDGTPPTTAHTLDGVPGEEGWFVSPVTVTLVPADNGSGVSETYYSLDGGGWITGTSLLIADDDFHILEVYSVDWVGNVEDNFPVSVKIDTQPPSEPVNVVTDPASWSFDNRFSISWANPPDLSGIAGITYKLDTEPTSPDDGIFVATSNTLTNVTVPTEGEHSAYLWLTDRAGNVNHSNHSVSPPLLYDGTAPTTTLSLEGIEGDNAWYTSPVTLSFASSDTLSGIAFTRFKINGSDWITGTTHLLSLSGKNTVQYQSEDIAGNLEDLQTSTIRVDSGAPGAPINLLTAPLGWSNQNSFQVIWDNPLDTSGIAGAYYKLDAPPNAPQDGTLAAAIDEITGITVPGEGRYDLYLWLRDNAGNTDHSRYAWVSQPFQYDGTPPLTAVQNNGAQGENGWYITPITVSLTATDTTSGIAATWWQLDGGQWLTGTIFTITDDGPHEGVVYSVDHAGNVETIQQLALRVDRRLPLAAMLPLEEEVTSPTFRAAWNGVDPSPGSGIATYDVQKREGIAGSWTNWQGGVTGTDALFVGERGRFYHFRVRALDIAGHQSPYPTEGPYVHTYIQSVANGSFGTGNFTNWRPSGILAKSVVWMAGPAGDLTFVARLGWPGYGPSIEDPGNVPDGSATVTQTVRVPDLADMPDPVLTFWYRVHTYDLIFSERHQRLFDTFDVTIIDAEAQSETLVLRSGNPTQTFGELYDTGWQRALIDLRTYAGHEITIQFANWNRNDNRFNTYSYMDDVRVMNWSAVSRHLPLASVNGGGSQAASSWVPPYSGER